MHKQYALLRPAYRLENIGSLSSVEGHFYLEPILLGNPDALAMAQAVMVEILHFALCDLVVHLYTVGGGGLRPHPPLHGVRYLDTVP